MTDRTSWIDERLIARLGLLATGAYLLIVALYQWERMGDANHPFVVVLSFLTYFVAFALIILAVSGFRLNFSSNLILLAFVFALVIRFYMHVADQPRVYGTDSLAFTHYSAELFVQGKNPYVEDMSPSYAEFRLSPLWRTPTMNGSYEVFLPYPSLHFLIFVPYLLMGLEDMRFVILLFHILVLLAVFLAAPRSLRPLVLIPFFIDPNVVNYTLGTVSDFIWVFFLLVAANVFPRHRLTSALFYGLSCAVKQQPWFLAPFLAIMIWQESRRNQLTTSEGASAVLIYLNLAAAVFFLVNLPFIVSSPTNWLRGVLAPLVDPLIMYGQGFSTLAQTGLVPLPKTFFLIAVVAVMLLLVLVYWKEYARLKHTLWFYPAVILWFSYRSLQSYFIYLVPVMMVALFEFLREQRRPESPSPAPSLSADPSNRMRTLAPAALGVAVIVFLIAGVALFTWNRQPEAIRVIRLYLNSDQAPTVNGLVVQVTNPTNKLVQPKFWVKMTGQQMLAWQASSGPTVLASGQTASFTIREALPEHAIWIGGTATVLITDAGTDSIIGYSSPIRVDPHSYYDLVNPGYAYWVGAPGSDNGHPLGWALTTEGSAAPQSASIKISEREGKSCLDLTMARQTPTSEWGRVVFDQWADFPNSSLTVTIYPESLSSLQVPPTTAVGVEILDDSHRIWYLFSPSEALSKREENTAYFFLPAPKDQWSTHVIDLARDYAELEWAVPALRLIPGDSLAQARRKVNFRFFIGTSSPAVTTYGACVAPIGN